MKKTNIKLVGTLGLAILGTGTFTTTTLVLTGCGKKGGGGIPPGPTPIATKSITEIAQGDNLSDAVIHFDRTKSYTNAPGPGNHNRFLRFSSSVYGFDFFGPDGLLALFNDSGDIAQFTKSGGIWIYNEDTYTLPSISGLVTTADFSYLQGNYSSFYAFLQFQTIDLF